MREGQNRRSIIPHAHTIFITNNSNRLLHQFFQGFVFFNLTFGSHFF